jgi:hypothetical protein
MTLGVLSLLLTSAFVAVWFSVGGAKDAMAFEESVLYGDRAEADGLTVKIQSQYGHYLYWNTAYAVGGNQTTDFHFFQNGRNYSDYIVYPGVSFDIDYVPKEDQYTPGTLFMIWSAELRLPESSRYRTRFH